MHFNPLVFRLQFFDDREPYYSCYPADSVGLLRKYNIL
jgi:hypothetical protein